MFVSVYRLVQVVEDVGLKLIVPGDREILSSGSVVLAVRSIDGTNFPQTSFNIFNTDNVQVDNILKCCHLYSSYFIKRKESYAELPKNCSLSSGQHRLQKSNCIEFSTKMNPLLLKPKGNRAANIPLTT